MPIEDLRARQRQAVIHSKAGMIALEIFRKTEMKPENIQRLQAAHGKYWHQSAAGLPDGWAEIVGQFLASVEDITDLANAVSLRFERCPDGLRAFAFPEISRWHPDQMNSMRIAQRNLLHSSRETCEWCGKGSAGPVELGDRVAFYLCEEDGASAREKLAAKVQAFDERVRFRGEVSILFQPHSNVWLQVSDQNMPILKKALLDIKKIVEDRGLVSKVYVTKIMESEGQLFLSARADKADPATQFEIADIVKHAELQSDQASLAAGKEDRDDA
ncbi:hypothetical protein [Agrobacterium tumefaciens]|uniref:hypothetical protein n=1 Tax=Agrobacterium tumefaciens TaxID=358 RepID=UPI00045B72D4|nr:hypothetical protein [Agrobacterium tumefaciens]CDN96514.1 hypothetical protein BN949_05693 [Agrobacterium tumefaciens]